MSLLIYPFQTIAQSAESLEARLSAQQWQRRVLLIYARDANNADLMAQKQMLAPQRAGLNERDVDQLIVLEADLTAADGHYLRTGDRRLSPSVRFIAYLIGKDGGVKQRFTRPVSPSELFQIVDAMPMRQSEMRRQR